MRHRLALLALFAAAVPALAQKPKELVVHLKTSAGADAGIASFKQENNGKLRIKLELKNLPEGDHAVHIHTNAVCDGPDFKTAGGHFNPDKKQHGLKNPMGHHNGDLPQNVSVGVEGTADASFSVTYLSLDPASPNSLFTNGGTAIMVHAAADDMVTDPTGGAGNRIACGVIVPAAQ